MTLIARIFILILIPNLVSCSYFSSPSFIKNRDIHYLSAKSVPPMHIPPGVSTQGIHNNYPISDRDYPESSKQINLAPPGLYQ